MTTTENGVAVIRPHAPGRIGQGTAVEQSRAVAEVEAAVVVAQRWPRSIDTAVREMHRSCAQKTLAEKAFFRYSRGGSQISGPSVQLARELARCWGNIQYGLTEMRRDDAYGQSEMQAWAWDIQTNARSSTTFIVPHRRDRSGGPVELTDMRDIYENNANNGARRLREMIFAVLPGWYTEDAVSACYATLNGDDGDLPGRVQKAIDRFTGRGISAAQLEQKLGAPYSRWTGADLAQLAVIWRSIERGEVTAEDEFPAAGNGRVSAADITAPPAPERAAEPPAGGGQAGIYHGGPKATPGQVGTIRGRFREFGFTEDEREQRLMITAKLADLPGLDSTSSLRKTEASAVIDKLKPENCADRDALIALMIKADQDGSDG